MASCGAPARMAVSQREVLGFVPGAQPSDDSGEGKDTKVLHGRTVRREFHRRDHRLESTSLDSGLAACLSRDEGAAAGTLHEA